MSSASVGDLFIDLNARSSKGEKALAAFERKGLNSAQKVEKGVGDAGQRGFGKYAEAGAKALVVMGAIELGTKSLTAATKVFQGQWEEAYSVIESLPAGIGPVAAAMRELADSTGEWLGLWESAKTINEGVAKSEEARLKNLERRKKEIKELVSLQEKFEAGSEALEMSGMSPHEQLRRERRLALDRLGELSEGMTSFSDRELIEETRKSIDQYFKTRFNLLDAAYQEEQNQIKHQEALSASLMRFSALQENQREIEQAQRNIAMLQSALGVQRADVGGFEQVSASRFNFQSGYDPNRDSAKVYDELQKQTEILRNLADQRQNLNPSFIGP